MDVGIKKEILSTMLKISAMFAGTLFSVFLAVFALPYILL